MDGEPEIAVADELGRARVDADPDPELDPRRPPMALDRPLGRHRRQNRVAGAEKGDEERVALRVDLVAPVLLERVAQEPLVFREDAGVPLAELPQEARRSLHVAKDEAQG